MTAVQTLHTSNMTYNLININNNSNNYINNNYNNDTCAIMPNILPSVKSETNSPIMKKSLKQRSNFGTNSGAHHPHQPASVARRNARERNRVKQVNNGFATLRQHIPSSIIAMSTLKMPNGTSVTTSNRTTNSTNKKLSKVETLRLAVEYIRCLQQLLDDHENECKNYQNHYANMNEMPDNFIYQDQNNLLQHLKQEQSPTSCLSPAPSYCSSNSSTLSTDGSLGFNYLTSTQSILYQQSNQQQNIENFENYQPTSPEDEELLDAITWWQQQ